MASVEALAPKPLDAKAVDKFVVQHQYEVPLTFEELWIFFGPEVIRV